MGRIERRFRKIFGMPQRVRHWQPSYSQEGEDCVLTRFFADQPKRRGTYVDIGAHHPERFSNTKLFYDRGWRGISIDPRPGFADEFLRARPDDVALELAISDRPGELTYFMFDEPALNGFDDALSRQRDETTDFSIVKEIPVRVVPLSEVLQRHLPPGTAIDFMSIDVEGFDHQVLSSNCWDRFRPRFVLVEIFGKTMNGIMASASAHLMSEVGYEICSRTRSTVFFEDQRPVTLAAA